MEQISKRILDIARQAKQMGVNNIYICGVTCRKTNSLANIIRDINLALRLVSNDEGFIFIANDNIFKTHLHGEGLHLNPPGYNILMNNILQHACTSY